MEIALKLANVASHFFHCLLLPSHGEFTFRQ
jgi:hypothetical protein